MGNMGVEAGGATAAAAAAAAPPWPVEGCGVSYRDCLTLDSNLFGRPRRSRRLLWCCVSGAKGCAMRGCRTKSPGSIGSPAFAPRGVLPLLMAFWNLLRHESEVRRKRPLSFCDFVLLLLLLDVDDDERWGEGGERTCGCDWSCCSSHCTPRKCGAACSARRRRDVGAACKAWS